MKIKKIFGSFFSALKFCSIIAGTFIALSVIIVLIFKWINPPVSSFIQIKSLGEISNFWDPPKINFQWVSIDEIPKHTALAVIASEDQRFFDHFGFDIVEIEKAIKERERKRRIRGASTITQQTVKNLFLTADKSWLRKGLEVYFTFLVEVLWSKKRIIEVYLNIAEFGPDTYGVEAASKKFFNRSAAKMNSSQSALLAAVLPNPKRFSAARPSGYILNRKERILRQMSNLGGVEYIKQNFE